MSAIKLATIRGMFSTGKEKRGEKHRADWEQRVNKPASIWGMEEERGKGGV